MKKLLIVLFLLIYSNAFSQNVDISKLPEAERIAIQERIQNQSTVPFSPKQVSEWAEMGKAVGVAISSTAKELNIEVNNFAQSPVGRITVAMIIWKVVAQDLTGLFLTISTAAFLFFIGLSLLNKTSNRIYDMEYENIPVIGGFFVRKVLKTKSKKRDLQDHEISLFICSYLLMAISVFTLLGKLLNF